MSMSDPIADMLNRIRNALAAHLELAELPHSKMNGEICRLLKREGYLADYSVEGGAKKVLRVYLKYDENREPVIRGLRRGSRPGLRRYVTAASIPKVLGGLGCALVSTSKGMMTGREARESHSGGELICTVW
jgi:small subunit ribosomal protein S8